MKFIVIYMLHISMFVVIVILGTVSPQTGLHIKPKEPGSFFPMLLTELFLNHLVH